MNDTQTHSVFYLLYAMVLVDKRVLKVETDLFFARVEGFLRTSKSIETLRAKTIISDWFVQNYKDIMREMKSSNRTSYVLEHVENLKHYRHRQDVFDMMLEMAMADNEFHDEERKLLNRVSEIWGLEANRV
jgi:uncharacterized tellurite resistance protein B-like protein